MGTWRNPTPEQSSVRGKLADLPRTNFAGVAELVDAHGLGPCGEIHESSNLSSSTAKFSSGRAWFRTMWSNP